MPSGHFFANGAWLCCAVLAHNVIRWSATLGQAQRSHELTVARSLPHRLLTVPERLVNRSGPLTLRGPRNWPWAQLFDRRSRQHDQSRR